MRLADQGYHDIMWCLIGLLGVFFAALWLTRSYLWLAHRVGWLDHPNHRSLHSIATPRGGGIGFVLVGTLWFIFCHRLGWLSSHQLMAILPTWICLGLLGFLDDRFSLRASLRFLIQTVLIFWTVMCFLNFTLTLFSLILLWCGLWSVNLFNFMDGIDGLAGVETMTVLLVGGIFLFFSGQPGLAVVCYGILASVSAFLFFNWPPAKVFMGDVGSYPLGFIIFAMALCSWHFAGISPLVWIILYGSFVYDATVTLLRRMIKGERWTEGHKSHAYQRLHQAGWSHQRVVLHVIGLNTVLCILASIAWREPTWENAIVGIAFLLLTCAYWWVESLFPMINQRNANASVSQI